MPPLLLICGCSSVAGIVQSERISRTEAALAAAGFHIEPGNTRERIGELKSLPPFTIVERRRGDEDVYLYADPVTCHCEYVGSTQQYAEYQRQRAEALNTTEVREARAVGEGLETYAERQAAWSSPWWWW